MGLFALCLYIGDGLYRPLIRLLHKFAKIIPRLLGNVNIFVYFCNELKNETGVRPAVP